MKLLSYWRKDWFLGLLVTLVFLALGLTGYLRSVDWKAYDLGVRLSAARPASPSVALVTIDDEAIQTLGSWPWPRDILARLTETLSGAKPAVIGYALPFDTKQSTFGLAYIEELKETLAKSGRTTEQVRRLLQQAEENLDTDRLFANSLQRAGPVVLATPYDLASDRDHPPGTDIADYLSRFTIGEVNGQPQREYLLERLILPRPVPVAASIYPPIAELTRYVSAVGHLNTGLDQQEQARREPLVIQYGEHYLPSFSLMMWARYSRFTAQDIEVNLQKHQIKLAQTPIRTDNKLRVYPNFYQGRDGNPPFKTYSVLQALDGSIPEKALREKAVIVGFTARQNTALLDSPMREPIAPVVFTAHVVSSLLNDDLYRVPAWGQGLQLLVMGGVALYLMFILPRLRLATGLALSALILFAILNATFILMIGRATWVPLMVPVLTLMVGHVLLGFKSYLAGSVYRIQNELSLANFMLGQSFHHQGQLDQAFERYAKCHIDETLLNSVYNLGLDYERKRQYNKAAQVFQFIHQHAPDFRDINERIKRTRQVSEAMPRPASSANVNATLILSDPGVQKPMIGRYQIDRELGRGAMGMVYLGHDPKIGRTVAIKTMVLAQEYEGDKLDEVKRRFFREAETAGRLNHPNIVTIYDVGEDEDLSYIAMDYLKGENLLAYCKPGSLLEPKEVIDVMIKVTDALDYAHGQNVVHRDIKPANIIYDRETGVLKVTDFGVACLTDSSKTKTGTILGSPSYMSPEQLAGDKVDGRSDLFSLGVTLFQMLTGELPFIGESLASLMYKITNEKHPDVRLFRPDLPSCMSRIVNKALAKELERRFQNGERFANALRRCRDRI